VNAFDPHSCSLSGSDTVRQAIYPKTGNASDPRFARYVKEEKSIATLKDGEDYVTGFIDACSSELGRELDHETWRITGGLPHVATVTPTSGFEWVIPPKNPCPVTATQF
jgi:hypothetical protein